MTNGFTALLVLAYLYANLILVPLFLGYLFVDTKRVSLMLVLRLHKLIVVLSVALPLVLFVMSIPEAQTASTAILSAVRPSQASAIVDVSSDADTALRVDFEPMAWNRSDELDAADDLAYFFGDFAVWLSLAGLLVFVARYGRQTVQIRRLAQNASRKETYDSVAILRSTAVSAPFSVGYVDRKVFLPCWLRSPASEVVIQHELNHFRCGHHWWSAVEAVLSHVFWFNPVSHVLRRRGEHYRELQCDAITTRDVDKLRYSRVLIESAEHILMSRAAILGGHSWVEKKGLNARIDFLLGEPRTTRRFASQAVIFVALAVAGAGLWVVGDLNDEFLQDEILETINRQYADTLTSHASVELDQVPDSFVHALLVYYDPRFYEHDGVRLMKMSTITQQVARSFLRLAHERSINRKLRELKVTRVLESNFTKDQILEMYLNRTFWGNRAHGLAAAAMVYFDKSYTELTQSESAMLIPFLEGPSAFNMLADSEVAARRQQDLLSRLNAGSVQSSSER